MSERQQKYRTSCLAGLKQRFNALVCLASVPEKFNMTFTFTDKFKGKVKGKFVPVL